VGIGSTLRQLVEIAIGPSLAKCGGIRVCSHPLIVRRAATPHVLHVEEVWIQEFIDCWSASA
jgi:hypothetical protein